MTKKRFLLEMVLVSVVFLASLVQAQTPGQVYDGGYSCFTDSCKHPMGSWTTPYMIAFRNESVDCFLGIDRQCVTGKAGLTFAILICPAGEWRECLWSTWVDE